MHEATEFHMQINDVLGGFEVSFIYNRTQALQGPVAVDKCM